MTQGDHERRHPPVRTPSTIRQVRQAGPAALLLLVVILLAVGIAAARADGSFAERLHRTFGAAANGPADYPVRTATIPLACVVDLGSNLGAVDRRLFGTNLEWFNDAGGLASPDVALRARVTALAADQGLTVMRYPGGTLADFYHWRDGIGPAPRRPVRRHPTDPGSSSNAFGTPEFLDLLERTGAAGLITVNAGTGSADEAAAWVGYTNRADNAERAADGRRTPLPVRDWEIGNELYLPGNPGEQIITLTPQEYVKRYLAFARAMKAVDPSIRTMAIGVAKAQVGPDTVYPDWTRVLLEGAADEIDVIAVHNAHFPLLDGRRPEAVAQVYPALWAAPEAVDRSLSTLEKLIDRYPTKKPIGIAVTEWGALFSLPHLNAGWFDHVKTIGSGIYVARMLQVLMTHPRVEFANYFKLTDRSFMGWIGYDGTPKVPYSVFRLYAKASGDVRLRATLDSPAFDTQAVGNIGAERDVADVTVVATRDTSTGRTFVNLVNRSLTTAYPVALDFGRPVAGLQGKLLTIAANEPTASNGRDVAPEQPWARDMEPWSSSPGARIGIVERRWDASAPIVLAPFSVATLVVGADDRPQTILRRSSK